MSNGRATVALEGARAAAAFVSDCVLLFKRLLSDPRVPRRKKLVLAGLIPYLLMPFDLVPDFIPVAGYLDDAVIVAFALRYVLLERLDAQASGLECVRQLCTLGFSALRRRGGPPYLRGLQLPRACFYELSAPPNGRPVRRSQPSVLRPEPQIA